MTPSSRSTAELVDRVRAGEPAALAELYSSYATPMLAVAYRLLGAIADAEDVLHDVFLGLPEAMRHYDERGALGAWLSRITTRVALSRLRRDRDKREISLADVPEPARSDAGAIDDLSAVQRAIDQLPDTLRTVFVLREIEGYSHAEIAALLEISTAASEVRLHRAVKLLRRRLQPE